MAIAFFKLEKTGEMSYAEAHAALGGHAQHVVRIDIYPGKTTIYFTADKSAGQSAELRSSAKEVKLADVTKLSPKK
jgi:hypothetical protein